MDWQILINIGLGVLIGFIGWFAREIWDSVKELRKDYPSHRKESPRNLCPQG
jgi:H+/Cl- antiporter ClcA